VEGKRHRILCQDCRAVSEVYGQLLMISIVVIAFGTIGMAVFSDGGAVKPEHTPNTDLRENINADTNDIQIIHSGGETIDLSAIKIILYVNGLQVVPPYDRFNFQVKDSDGTLRVKNSDGTFKSKNSDGTYSSNNVFRLGDCIIIDTDNTADPANPTKKLDLKTTDDIDMFFVDTPSEQVIQKAVLQKGSRESKFPYWITPHPYGSVYDSSTKEWLPTELTDGINDNLMTDCQMYKGQWSSETFTFGIDQYGLNLKDPLTKVELKIVYTVHDDSQQQLTLEINDKNPDTWVNIVPSNINLEKYKTIIETDEELPVFDITDQVKTVEELRNLKVRFSAYGNADSNNKFGWVDFIAIHAE
jgi:Protein of unknown function (DUF1628).